MPEHVAHSIGGSMNNLDGPIVNSVEGEEAGNMAGETDGEPVVK